MNLNTPNIEILTVLWFLIPGGVANITASISAKIWPKFNLPLDLFFKFRGKRIFGEHKTYRGLISGTIAGAIAYFLQDYFTTNISTFEKIILPNYGGNLFLAFLLPFGALMGDATKSFFKRQFDINPGKSWFPFDQIDWLIGTMILSYTLIKFDIKFALNVLIIGFLLHILIKFIGFIIKLQTEKF